MLPCWPFHSVTWDTSGHALQVKVAADANGSWTRYLGLELAPPDQPGPRSLRYAAIVDDGVLLKLVRRGFGGCRQAFVRKPAMVALHRSRGPVYAGHAPLKYCWAGGECQQGQAWFGLPRDQPQQGAGMV
jgi:hypothetical protein